MSPNELFCAVLHDETCRIMREFFDGEDPAFGNMVGEVHREIIREIPVDDMEERIRQLCREMKNRRLKDDRAIC
jgi:hypothetical protein